MAEELIGNLGYETPQSDTKRQKLLECILTGNSKLYLGKVYTEEQLAKLSEKEVEKLFSSYEDKLSGQMVKSLGRSIINIYSMGACSALGIRNQEALSEDLENDPFLNSALQRFTCELYYRFGLFSAPQGWISDMGIDGPTFVPKSGYFLLIWVKVCPQKLAFS